MKTLIAVFSASFLRKIIKLDLELKPNIQAIDPIFCMSYLHIYKKFFSLDFFDSCNIMVYRLPYLTVYPKFL